MDEAWAVVGTWAGAAATFAAVVVALWLGGREQRARGRDARRYQAERITAWLSAAQRTDSEGRGWGGLVLRNASDQVAYRCIATAVDVRGSADAAQNGSLEFRVLLSHVPPGTDKVEIEQLDGAMGLRAGIEIAFQDAAGHNWRRKAEGELVEIKQDPASYYGLSEPLPWRISIRA
ncbi:MAG TPA: hypothetical protein VEX41_03840 [Candidatus Eisenbacteria bacterium]|nr:hypothetical protein [Candidatus Eisenbacteria bacterium]